MKFRPVFSLHVFQSYIHHVINMLFFSLVKNVEKKNGAFVREYQLWI